jgi:phage tail sheath protein FI
VTPTYPGVYIQELISPVHAITGVATSIAAFVGYTARGIDNRPEQVFSFGDYERLFGGLASDSEVSYSVQQFFANGGGQAYVVRTPRAGAAAAQVQFGATSPNGLTFTALSSGSWANGQLLIDIDYNGLYQVVPGTVSVTSGSATVTGKGFQAGLTVGQFLVFASDSTATPYQIKSIANDTSLTLASNYAGTTTAGTSAIVSGDPLAFNVTVTNLADGTVESFPNVSLNSSRQNYVLSVINDPDNGSQLVGVQVTGALTAPPAMSGVVGTPITANTVNSKLCATALTGNVAVTNGSPTVTGTPNPAPTPGQSLVFTSDPTATPYAIKTIVGSTITLTTPYTGPTNAATTASLAGSTATADFGIKLDLTSPSGLAPFPLNSIRVFSQGAPVPQTAAGLAAQLQQATNNALAVQMPGASVACSVSAIGAKQAIRVNALIPRFPDAVIAIAAPGGGLSDASDALGLQSPSTTGVAHYALGTGNGTANSWGGNLNTSTPGGDGTGLPGTQQLVGDPAQFTGIYALQKVDLFNLLCIPDATRAAAGNPNALDSTVDPNTIFSAAIALCDQSRAFLLIDPPPNVNTVPGALDWKTSQLIVHDPNGAAYFPRLRLTDPLNNFQLRSYAPCGVVAGLYARIDGSRGVWKAPAGTEATLTGVQSLVYKMNDAENGVLNPLGLNCFRGFPVYGNVMWGARTLVGADADANQWKYVPVRRIALYIEESLYRGTQWVVFEPNDEPLWAAIRLNVGSFMNDLFRKGAFQGLTPNEAYLVKCDSETTTQSDIDNGIVNILVGFAPLKPAEFVIIKIQQLAGQSQA